MSDKKLEPGMLLLDPGTDTERPTVWTVISAKTILAHYGDCSAKATLRSSSLPVGWKIVNNRALAAHLRKEFSNHDHPEKSRDV